MPKDGVELIGDMYAAFHGGDAARALSYFDEDVEVDATAGVDGGIGRGRDELGRIIGQWVGGFDEWHEDIEQMHQAGEVVCVIAVQHGRGRNTGIETQTRYAVTYRVERHAITRMKLYRDPADALADLEAS